MRTLTRHVATAGFLGVVIAVLLFATAWIETSDAKPKKIVKSGGTCTCTCRSDERMDTFGRPPRYSQEVSGHVNYTSDCTAQNGGGCRIKLENGSYTPGTSSSCSYKSNSEAANIGDTAPSDQEPEGPLGTFQRPGMIFEMSP